MNPNGYYFTPSPDGRWTYAGSGVCFLRDTLTGVEIQLHAETRCQGSGWPSLTTLILLLGPDDGSPQRIVAHDAATHAETELYTNVHASRYAYSGHGGIAWAFAGGTAYYQGAALDPQPGYWFGACDGDLVAFRGNEDPPQIHVYRGTRRLFTDFCLTTCVEVCCSQADNLVGYGYNTRPYLFDAETGKQWPCGVTNDQHEGPPWVCEGWVGTTRESPPQALLRPIDSPTAIVIDLSSITDVSDPNPANHEGPVGVRFSSRGDEWLVGAWSNKGRPFETTVRKNAPRVKPDGDEPEPPDPPATFLRDLRSPNPVGPRYARPTEPDPVIPHIGTMHNGLFYAQSGAYGYNDDWAKNADDGKGLWLRAPGNCCVIAGEARCGITAPFDHVIMTPDAILGGMADRPEYWRKVAGFYLAAEASSNGVERMKLYRRIAQMSCAELGVPCPPFFTYTPGRDPALAMIDDVTAIGLELYANPGETAGDLEALSFHYRNLVPMGTPVCIYGMAYDRNGDYYDDLRPIILAAADVARAWEKGDPDTVKGLFYFSDGRGKVAENFGGARWHPEVYPLLRGIAAAIESPSI